MNLFRDIKHRSEVTHLKMRIAELEAELQVERTAKEKPARTIFIFNHPQVIDVFELITQEYVAGGYYKNNTHGYFLSCKLAFAEDIPGASVIRHRAIRADSNIYLLTHMWPGAIKLGRVKEAKEEKKKP